MSEQQSSDRIEVTITYLEQTERPVLKPVPRPRRKVAILRAETPPAHFYRYLYHHVGEAYNWVTRSRLSDSDLEKIIHDPRVFIYVLYIDGVPGGFAEVDERDSPIHEIKFFGLTPEFLGAGLGRYFLTNIVDLAWSRSPEKLRLETCSADHPAALPLYQQLGFQVFDRRQGVIDLVGHN